MTKVQANLQVDMHAEALSGLAAEVRYDHRRFPRRRGKVLARAIGEAVIEELAERGYNSLTFEGVASRAGTGKSTLYRRWADKPSMVVDCLSTAMPGVDDFDLTGDLRHDLTEVLASYAVSCAGTMGVALRVVCGEAVKCQELQRLWRERAAEPRLGAIRDMIQKAIDRGDARPGATADECVMVGPAMVGHLFMATDTPPTRAEVERIVDNVLIPMLRAR
ncbi:MAG: TetR/AcrR family transcriptional regulator [Streptomycetaceae bacterium]|nr:TetR/AcrR family transcriptional regulator [Streptomycetaceae bacterium]